MVSSLDSKTCFVRETEKGVEKNEENNATDIDGDISIFHKGKFVVFDFNCTAISDAIIDLLQYFFIMLYLCILCNITMKN